MPLEDYARKRSFDKTPEPPPAPVGVPAGRRFYVQRHHARRLHYDLRLEIDGTLKSWAVPKGPTLDPAEKRLAVLVEDHPLDYGDFEGAIPEGNYGAGSVMVWDRGWYELLGDKTAGEQLERGDLKFRLHGDKLQGEFALVRMKNRGKGNEWLLIKKKDAAAQTGWDAEKYAQSVLSGRTQEEIARGLMAARPERAAEPSRIPGAVQAPMPLSVIPMKAFPAAEPPEGPEWVYEAKWDGVRAICFLDRGKVRLVSRTGKPWEAQYPELSVLPHYVAAETAVIDGEIVALDERGRPSFPLIQPRITVADAATIARLSRTNPVALLAFDLLYVDGYDLRGAPLVERKRALQAILKPDPLMRYSAHFTGSGKQFLEAARQQGLEGVVAKRARSRYESKRSTDWIKVKIVAQQEFVICGYTQGERGAPGYFGSLVLGVYENGNLVWAGNVGAGFDQQMLERIWSLLQPLAASRCPFSEPPKIGRPVTWVRPELVCTVRFSSWTPDGRLRAPVFLGLRPDAGPRDCVREMPQPGGESGAAQPADAPVRAAGPLLAGKAESAVLEIEGKRLKFTNLNKVFYPREGYTKRDIINFYDAVSGLILPHLRGRPLSLKRYPDGIEGGFFFQKRSNESFAPWLRIEPIVSEHSQAVIPYVVCDDRATLLYLANLGCIDQNPWMSRVGSLENPDFLLIDLDPQECAFHRIVEAAQLIRRKLDLLELEGYPKTTGGRGMHIYVPLEPRYTYAQVRSFAEIIARIAAAERPDLFTTPRPVAQREKGKVYFDYLQISESKTVAAPYVLRAYPGAPVATPLAWGEVANSLSPGQFHIRNALDRFARVGDLFAPVLDNPQPLEPALQKLEPLVRDLSR
jgi:bifunctional non-homologous end joining protein LigD